MTTVKTYAWDVAEHLDSEEAIQAYLDACLEEHDPKLLAAALGDIAKARGMTQVARDAGMGRESLYKALSPEGNPELGTILNVLKALGLRLHVGAAI
jgi:probable addiction module antidote protein